MRHEMTIQLNMYGARVLCSCGWSSPEITKPWQAQGWVDRHQQEAVLVDAALHRGP